MVQSYETVIIFKGDISTATYDTLVSKATHTLHKFADIYEVDKKGKKSLAYEIKECKTGWYVLFTFKTDPENIAQWERYLRITDEVIKFMTIRLSEHDFEERYYSKVIMDDIIDPDDSVKSEQAIIPKIKIIDYWDNIFMND